MRTRGFRQPDQESARRLLLGGLSERWSVAFDADYNDDLDDIAATYLDSGAEVWWSSRATTR